MVSESTQKKIHQHKQFLHSLVSASNKHFRNKIFANASDSDLDTLLKVLYLIFGAREIPLKKHLYQQLKTSKRINFLVNNFGSKSKYVALKQKSREEKLKVLRHISKYNVILFNLFHHD